LNSVCIYVHTHTHCHTENGTHREKERVIFKYRDKERVMIKVLMRTCHITVHRSGPWVLPGASSETDPYYMRMHMTIRQPLAGRTESVDLCTAASDIKEFYLPSCCPCGQEGVVREECPKCMMLPWVLCSQQTFLTEKWKTHNKHIFASPEALFQVELNANVIQV
jgi:hypothetical protein